MVSLSTYPIDRSGAQIALDNRAQESLDDRVVRLYDEYFDFVYRSLKRLGVSSASLEDAAQEVFIVVHRRLESFEERASIKSWIFAITLRIAKNYRRKDAKERIHVNESDAHLICPRGTPEEAHANARAGEMVIRLLEGLDDEKRAVFVLAELEDVPAPEIAIALGLPLNTVYSRLRLARVAFEEGLKRLRAKDEWRYR